MELHCVHVSLASWQSVHKHNLSRHNFTRHDLPVLRYSYQDCLNYNTTAANQTCSGAMSGEDDDMTIAGVEVCSCPSM